MKTPDFEHHKKCYELLKQVWDAQHKMSDPVWRTAVYDLLGPSADQDILFPGDEVELLVDGFRGQFKGHTAIVISGGRHGATVRVPGATVLGETEEYQGPYMRDQLKLLRRAGA